MFRIAIDGLASVGKSSLADKLAEHYGILHLGSSGFYRMFALAVLNAGIDSKDEKEVIKLLPKVKMEIEFKNGKQVNILNGKDVGGRIYEIDCSTAASHCSVFKDVRAHMTKLTQEIAKKIDMVVDGRDIACVVIPDAEAKLLITCDFDKRVDMRFNELQAKKSKTTREEVVADLKTRDHDELTRPVVFVAPQPDSIVLDITNLTLDESAKKAIELIDKKIKGDK